MDEKPIALQRLEIEYLLKLVEFPEWLVQKSTRVNEAPTRKQDLIEGCPMFQESSEDFFLNY